MIYIKKGYMKKFCTYLSISILLSTQIITSTTKKTVQCALTTYIFMRVVQHTGLQQQVTDTAIRWTTTPAPQKATFPKEQQVALPTRSQE